jgi:hypothetical protein
MNMEEIIQQSWWSLQRLWAWLNYEVRDNPLLVLGALAVIVVIWRFLAPKK